jgi:hypothetical protein
VSPCGDLLPASKKAILRRPASIHAYFEFIHFEPFG